MSRLFFAFSLFAFSLMLSCGGSATSSSSDSSLARGENVATTQTITNEFGVAAIDIELPEGINKIALTSTSSVFLATDYIVSSSGVIHAHYEQEQIASGLSYAPYASTVNVPSRDFDPKLTPELYHASVSAAMVNDATGEIQSAVGVPIDFALTTKSDGDLNTGSLQLNLVYVGEVTAMAEVGSLISAAVQEMQNIYTAQAAISLNVSELSYPGPSALPLPPNGSALYGEISTTAPGGGINVCLGIDSEQSGILGVAPAIPGPPIPTVTSCVAVSLLAGAGPDGVYSAAEVLLLGETLAHEVGHYLGLFHPVESNLAQFDPLPDTAQCTTVAECTSLLGTNLMFPAPITDASGTYVRQNTLSVQQKGVMNRYVLVD